MIFVTGGAGFIGANFVQHVLAKQSETVVNVDKLTYAGNLNNFSSFSDNPKHLFVRADIGDTANIRQLLGRYLPRAVVHFAAESHVDRSIYQPDQFIQTNINGTFSLLEACLAYWRGLGAADQQKFRFVQISTDEVYGSLTADMEPFSESTPYAPNSPYAASKAGADHLVRAYHHTYGMPTLTTNCSNNYGPFQFPEKLIPLVIANARAGKPLPIYGNGLQIRDWLYVNDHCTAISRVLESGVPGQTYNIGGQNEKTNLGVVTTLCDILDELVPKRSGSYRDQITFVKDRPGHDQRYAIDARKIAHELGWKPVETFDSGIRKTVTWYLRNEAWVHNVQSGEYLAWLKKNYA